MAARRKTKKTRDAELLFAVLLEAQAAIIGYQGSPPPAALTEGYRKAVLRFNKVSRFERAAALRDGAMAIREMVRDNGGENTTGRPARKHPSAMPKNARRCVVLMTPSQAAVAANEIDLRLSGDDSISKRQADLMRRAIAALEAAAPVRRGATPPRKRRKS